LVADVRGGEWCKNRDSGLSVVTGGLCYYGGEKGWGGGVKEARRGGVPKTKEYIHSTAEDSRSGTKGNGGFLEGRKGGERGVGRFGGA